MFRSRCCRPWWAVVAVCSAVLVVGSVGTGEALAGNCALNNFTFQLGQTNTCNVTTLLTGSTSSYQSELTVLNQGAQGTALYADAPAGIAIQGYTNQSIANDPAIVGQQENANGEGAGVYGQTNSSRDHQAGATAGSIRSRRGRTRPE